MSDEQKAEMLRQLTVAHQMHMALWRTWREEDAKKEGALDDVAAA